MFGIFHDAGYRGLYGGLGADAIKACKGIDPKEQLMDRMDRTELAANEFWMTQTREKLKREGIKNQRDAIEAHETVGKEVRAAKRPSQNDYLMTRMLDCCRKIFHITQIDFLGFIMNVDY